MGVSGVSGVSVPGCNLPRSSFLLQPVLRSQAPASILPTPLPMRKPPQQNSMIERRAVRPGQWLITSSWTTTPCDSDVGTCF